MSRPNWTDQFKHLLDPEAAPADSGMRPALRLTLKCLPPNTTAQGKRLVMGANGQPRFFHGAKMNIEAATWAHLLAPHRPPAPFDCAVALTVVGIWPHTAGTPRRDQGRCLPKVTKPDASNFTKHLEDQLVRLRFLTDDNLVSRLVIEKWRGPESLVGIRIEIVPVCGMDLPCLQ